MVTFVVRDVIGTNMIVEEIYNRSDTLAGKEIEILSLSYSALSISRHLQLELAP